MRVNHLHLMVPSVPEAAGILREIFRAAQDAAATPVLPRRSTTQAFVLTRMKLGSKSTGTYPANFHAGFFLDSEAKVDAIHGRMVADGLDAAAPKREHSYSFYEWARRAASWS